MAPQFLLPDPLVVLCLIMTSQLPALEFPRRRHQGARVTRRLFPAGLGSARTAALWLGALVSPGKGGGWTRLGDDVLDLMDVIECLWRVWECEKETSFGSTGYRQREENTHLVQCSLFCASKACAIQNWLAAPGRGPAQVREGHSRKPSPVHRKPLGAVTAP